MTRRTTDNATLIVGLLGVMVAGLAQGATLRYRGCGDYTNVFALTGTIGWYDPSVPGATSLPGPGDLIRVNNGCTVTVTTVETVGGFQVGVDESGHLVVASGGKLSAVASLANAVGYNGYAQNVYGRMTVNTNGEVDCFYHLHVGYTGFGVVTLDGGTLNLSHHLWVGGGANGNGSIILTNGGTLNMTGANNNNGMIGLGTTDAIRPSGGIGTIKVSDGSVLNLYNIDGQGRSIQSGSVLDISGSGMVTIPGDKTSVVSDYYTSTGKITAYGGTGTVVVDYDVSNPGKTTLKATGGYVPPTDCTWIATSGLGLWSDPANWSCGPHPAGVKAAIFNFPGAIPCTVNGLAMASCIVMGTNGPGGTLIITNGGSLTCGADNPSYIGENSTALMVVESGATVSFGGLLRLGFDSGSDGTLLINGGAVSASGIFDMGYQGGKGTVQLKGGTLNLAQFDDYLSIQGESVMDVSGTGKVVINGDHKLAMTSYISTGQITNSSGAGLLVDYNIINPGKTTVYPSSLVLSPAQAVWNPALNPSGTGLWSETGNWNVGMCPGDVTAVTFNVAGAVPCVVTNAAAAGYISMGSSAGPGGTLIITNGGSLTTLADNWCAVGYSSNALMMVENGGWASFASHLWVGSNPGADGTLIIDAGTVWVGGMVSLGWNGGKGTVIITNGGRLILWQWHPTASIQGESVLDITGRGTVVITGNYVSSVSNYISNGRITANGSPNVAYGFDPGANETTLQVAPPQQTITGATSSGGNVTLSYQTTAGHFYHVESTPSLFPALWTRLTGSTTNATGASVTFTFPASADQRFYRTASP